MPPGGRQEISQGCRERSEQNPWKQGSNKKYHTRAQDGREKVYLPANPAVLEGYNFNVFNAQEMTSGVVIRLTKVVAKTHCTAVAA